MVGFWFFMLIMDMLVPCVMIGFGHFFSKQAPKEINSTFGYRTNMSMKNKDTWEFAHKYCGRLWFRIGLIMAGLSAVSLLTVFGKDIEKVGIVGVVICFAQLIPMLCSIIPVEIALKKTFDKNGRRKNVQKNG